METVKPSLVLPATFEPFEFSIVPLYIHRPAACVFKVEISSPLLNGSSAVEASVFCGVSESSAESASGSREALLHGEAKERLSGWWLNLIEEEVEAKLSAVWKYHLRAVPYNYLDEAPRDMGKVQENLQLIQTLLDPSYAEKNLVENNLILPLRKIVYQEIDILRDSLQIVVWDIFNSVRIPLSRNFSSAEALSRFKSFSERVGSKLASLVLNAVQDLEYIEQMYVLELRCMEDLHRKESSVPSESPMKNAASRKPDDVVPVTGLIFSKLRRIENELLTVLDHWHIQPRKRLAESQAALSLLQPAKVLEDSSDFTKQATSVLQALIQDRSRLVEEFTQWVAPVKKKSLVTSEVEPK